MLKEEFFFLFLFQVIYNFECNQEIGYLICWFFFRWTHHVIHISFLEPFLGAGATRGRGAVTSPPLRPPCTPAPRGPNTVQPCRTPGQPPPPPLLPVGQREDSCEIVSSLKILDCSSTQVVALRWPEMDFCNCKMYENMFCNFSEEHQEFSFERNYYIATILLVHDDFQQVWYCFIIL